MAATAGFFRANKLRGSDSICREAISRRVWEHYHATDPQNTIGKLTDRTAERLEHEALKRKTNLTTRKHCGLFKVYIYFGIKRSANCRDHLKGDSHLRNARLGFNW